MFCQSTLPADSAKLDDLYRYSMHTSSTFKKYYKTSFLGLIDMALVNAYIVFKARAKQQGHPTPRHDEFYKTLQVQLLPATADDFEIFDVSSSC